MDTIASQKVADSYAVRSSTYDEDQKQLPYYQNVRMLIFKFDWSGSVLDLACGTGLLGRLLHEKGTPYTIMGVDLSPVMTDSPSIRNYYQIPVTIGTIQDAIAQPTKVQHVACFGALTYLNDEDFIKFLEQAQKIAQVSITFDIEDTPQSYLEKAAKDSSLLTCYNHTEAWRDYGTPAGWKLVYNKYELQYNEAGFNMNGTVIRLEKE